MIADARAIWDAAVAAVDPFALVRDAACLEALAGAPRILVVGAGKAGAAMAAGLEARFGAKLVGLVNVPDGATHTTHHIRLHAARPAGSNHPTQAGVDGAEAMLALLGSASADDVAVCLLSGGGSALLPAPAHGLTLADKQTTTRLLHASGATIGEMNCVRKHLSRVKGGRLAQAFRGRKLLTLVISDVVGDPLDVIASGPTVPDPTTFADARAVLAKYEVTVPDAVRNHLERAADETPKQPSPNAETFVLGSNAVALDAASAGARRRGYAVLDLGPFIEGETASVAATVAAIVRNIRGRSLPVAPPACVLMGGETTVSLGTSTGKGGRNQEFALAFAQAMPDMHGILVLSAGTDGEDGPTDAAGAWADAATLDHARRLGFDPADVLARHDSYTLFDATGNLLRTGLTGTNVMDVRIVLVADSSADRQPRV